MEGWIGSLSGFFDGYEFHQGPVSILIEDGIIKEIDFVEISNPEITGKGLILTPPFVDGHTHLIFGGTRFNELSMKLSGKSYSDILTAGGGIQSTVNMTRETSSAKLKKLVIERLDTMLTHGSLAVEVKSGYGLNFYEEIRLLEILNSIEHTVDIVPTFGAAHVIPKDVKRTHYIEEIIDKMLPEVVKRSLATSTDVFCDKGAFDVDETIQIFEASRKYNLPVRVHAEELEYRGIAIKSAEMFNVLSADHLLYANYEDFKTLEDQKTVAMFMPLAPFGLFSDQLPTGFLDTDVTIGIGSDFNPNNWAISIQTAIRMLVYRYRINPVNAVKAATMGSFQGVYGRKPEKLEVNQNASFLLIKSSSLEEFVSKFGQNLVKYVFKEGRIVIENDHITT